MKDKVYFEEINTKTEEYMAEYILDTVDAFMDIIKIIDEEHCDSCWKKYNEEKDI